jgi:hypothetical protein
MRSRKRSSCDSGKGKVPIWLEGFWVAMTKNGSGSGRVSPSVVTCPSSMASSRALCVFGRGAVDLVGQQHLREHRSGQEPETAALAVEDRDAEDVRRQHVAGELDARKLEAEQAGQGVRQRRLADAGQIFDQQMASCQQAAEGESGLRALAEDHRIGGGEDFADWGGSGRGWRLAWLVVVAQLGR